MRQEPKVSAAIALRAALRVLPVALNLRYFRSGAPQPVLTAALFHATSISWYVSNVSTQDITDRASAARAAADAASYAAADVAADAAFAARAAADAATDAAYAARAAVDAVAAVYAAVDAVDAAADAAAAADDATESLAIWRIVERDCESIAAGTSPKALLAQPLWSGAIPEWAQDDIKAMEAHLAMLGDGFDLWTAWYRRRLIGDASGFGLPADGETELARRLIEEDNGWWKREPILVNGDIKAWIDELRPPPDFDAIKARIEAGAMPQFGSEEEQRCRAALQERIEALRLELESLDQPPAPIGHNRPPVDLEIAEDEDVPAALEEVRKLSVGLANDVQPVEPDIPNVLEKLSRLQKIGLWFAKKADVFAEEMAKSAGGKFGGILGGGLAFWLISKLPGVQAAFEPVFQAAWVWLQSLLPVI
jgi:hypothetical protein